MLRVLIALLAAQADAGPEADGGAPDAGAPPAVCGTLTGAGACFGGVAAWCSEENIGGGAAAADVLVEDCAGGACFVIDGLGAWCYAAAAAPCAFEAGERASTHACGPIGPLPDQAWGCDVVDGCVSIPVGGCGDGCVDATRLRLGCAPFDQPVLLSCAALGGACQDAACTDLEPGAPCDERLRCAEGLDCVAGVCVASEPGVAVDAGPADPAPPAAPAPWCGSGSEPLVLALAALAWRRRRARSTPVPPAAAA